MSRLIAILPIIIAAVWASGMLAPGLDRRPMHVDEAVHAFRFKQLIDYGTWDYDPRDFHGPTLNYATLAAWAATGQPSFAATGEAMYRGVAVAFGVGLIVVLLLVGDGLGRGAAAAAAGILAISPAFAFYSRYYIMEVLLVFFTFAVIATGWRYARSGRLTWAGLCGASIGLMHATKETFVLNLAAMAAALAIVLLWRRPRQPARRPREPEGAGAGVGTVPAIGVAIVAAVLVSVAAYSVGFRNWGNVTDSVRTYGYYLQRAGGAGLHEQPWHYYIGLLAWSRLGDGPVFSELAVLLLAGVGAAAWRWPVGRDRPTGARLPTAEGGCATCPSPGPSPCGGGKTTAEGGCATAPHAGATTRRLGRPDRSLQLFILLYAVMCLAVYSAIPYKTPWTILSAYHAIVLLAGLGVAWLCVAVRPVKLRVGLGLALTVAGGHLAWQSYRANFVMPADPRNPYVYSQTTDDIRRLAARIEQLAGVAGSQVIVKTYDIPDDFWPILWQLRRLDADRIGHWPEPPADADAPIIVASPRAEAMLVRRIRELYVPQAEYQIRPGTSVRLFVQAGLWQQFERSQPGEEGP